MNFVKKRILETVFLFIFCFSFSQSIKNDSLKGEFTYLLQYKPNSLNRNQIQKELFSLQVCNNRAFFISEKKLKSDSLMMEQYNRRSNGNIVFDMRGFPSSKFKFLIIQTNENIQFFENVKMTLLSYITPVINNWKLIDETKVINSITCKKAEINYKGREWTAWYTTDIPFPYGPYKFSGLPGLIVKITDKNSDYDFELVKSEPSSKLKGKVVTVNKARYESPKIITKKELEEAKENARQNARQELESMGTIFSKDQRDNRQRLSEKEKEGYNPIELDD